MPSKNRIGLILLLAVIFCGGASHAGPGKVVNYLMDEPVSMFDWGIYRMQRALDTALTRDNTTTVSYIWDEDVIEISVKLLDGFKDKEEMLIQCEGVVKTIKELFGVDPYTGKLIAHPKHGNMRNYFRHCGFKKPTEPKALLSELNTKTRIFVTGSILGHPQKSGYAKSSLLGNEIVTHAD